MSIVGFKGELRVGGCFITLNLPGTRRVMVLEDPMTLAACALALVVAWLWLARLPAKVKVVTVIDGDTVMAVDRKGVRRKIRLKGIDALEKGQPGSEEASAALRQWTQGEWARASWRGKDRYGRYLARLRVSAGDLSCLMVKSGHAFPAESGWLRVLSWGPRLRRQGVWGQAARPHQSWRRRVRLVGWLMWRLERRRRRR